MKDFSSIDACLLGGESREQKPYGSENELDSHVRAEIVRTLEQLIPAVKDGHISGLMFTAAFSDEARDHTEKCGFGMFLTPASELDHLIDHAKIQIIKAAKARGFNPVQELLSLLRGAVSSDEDADSHKKH